MLPIPTATTTLETIRSCWQVPYIAHFCTLFNKYLDLPSFDTEDLELSLLKDPVKENLVPELITRLLRKCDATLPVKDRIGINTYDPFLELLVRKTCEEEKRPNPYHVAAAASDHHIKRLSKGGAAGEAPLVFDELPVPQQTEILQWLCEARFESTDAQKLIESAEPDSLRVLPLGYDSEGAAYYYFFGTRLYKESNRFPKQQKRPDGANSQLNGSAAVLNGEGTSRASSSASSASFLATPNSSILLNGSLLSGAANTSAVNASGVFDESARLQLATTSAEPDAVKWELECETETDWAELTKRLAKSKKTKAECALVKVLEENFLPNLTQLFRNKERDDKFSINKYIPVRASSRITALVEIKQREEEEQKREQKLEDIKKFLAPPLAITVPFERQFQYVDGEVQPVKRKSKEGPVDAENYVRPKRHKEEVDERSQRAERRQNGYLEETRRKKNGYSTRRRGKYEEYHSSDEELTSDEE